MIALLSARWLASKLPTARGIKFNGRCLCKLREVSSLYAERVGVSSLYMYIYV